MELKLTLLIVASLIVCATSYKCTQSDWAKFKEEYNKYYDLAEDDLFHYNTFCENLVIIKQHNHEFDIGEVNHKLEVTKYTDMSPPEIEAYRKSHGIQKTKKRVSSRRTTTDDEE